MFPTNPIWKDTCTLDEILKNYLQKQFPKAQQTFVNLSPQEGDKGLDHWNDTLQLVADEFSQLIKNFPELEKEREIYISHQAGTPAVSSALQFVSLTRFGKAVKFLVSNEYDNKDNLETELIEGSKYLRGIQVEQAKKLVETSPGAAHKLLEKVEDIEPEYLKRLQEYVDFFNLNRSQLSNQDEFSIQSATQRIVDVLDLIGIFLEQENYLQGITLLSAAQETFMKIAILSKTSEMIITLPGGESLKGEEILEWNHRGLVVTNNIKNRREEHQKKILQSLSCSRYKQKDIDDNFSNSTMLPWLKQLEPQFKSWLLLDWSCKSSRNREDDLRNQLFHNLQGMDDQDVIKYLLGDKNSRVKDVMDTYNNHVKQAFTEAIKLFNFPYKREKLKKELEKLANNLS